MSDILPNKDEFEKKFCKNLRAKLEESLWLLEATHNERMRAIEHLNKLKEKWFVFPRQLYKAQIEKEKRQRTYEIISAYRSELIDKINKIEQKNETK